MGAGVGAGTGDGIGAVLYVGVDIIGALQLGETGMP